MPKPKRIFTAEAAAAVRLQFSMAGADIVHPRNTDNVAVELNDLDMDYRGYVPRDIALDIMNGRIPQEHVPHDYLSPNVLEAEAA